MGAGYILYIRSKFYVVTTQRPFKRHRRTRQMDGVEYSQSTALLRYAGRISGLIPEDPLAALKVGRAKNRVSRVYVSVL